MRVITADTTFEKCYYCGATDVEAVNTREGQKPLPHDLPNGGGQCVFGTQVDAVTEEDLARRF